MLEWIRAKTTHGLGRVAASCLHMRRPALRGERLVDHWTLGGVGPRTVEYLASRIEARRPRAILECGPGTSTIAMARATAALGLDCRIVSLEHDRAWAAIMRRRLAQNGLGDRVELLMSRLRAHGGVEPFAWYDRVEAARARGPYDFVVIDGPPSRDGQARRSPALPLLWDSIADGALIVLDDGRRAGERACVRGWMDRYGDRLSATLLPIEKGLWALEKAPAAAAVAVDVIASPWARSATAGAAARA